MHFQDAKELAANLARARYELSYYPHRYAAWLLGRAAGAGASMRALKASHHARLLDNALVREVAARAGDGVLTRRALERAEPGRGQETYRIAAAVWGPRDAADWEHYWHQTTRRGVNLVVLPCFPPQHDACYRRLLDPAGRLPAVCRLHPHARAPRVALAWTRLDVDLARGEALVEEVQSDWIANVGGLYAWCLDLESGADRDRLVQRRFANRRARFDDLARYWLRVLAHHRAWWAEATLFAALWVLVERLCVRRIYYHTYEGGRRRKDIGGHPPRSLYTKLPERFGFELTAEGPAFLRNPEPVAAGRKASGPAAPWYRLEL